MQQENWQFELDDSFYNILNILLRCGVATSGWSEYFLHNWVPHIHLWFEENTVGQEKNKKIKIIKTLKPLNTAMNISHSKLCQSSALSASTRGRHVKFTTLVQHHSHGNISGPATKNNFKTKVSGWPIILHYKNHEAVVAMTDNWLNPMYEVMMNRNITFCAFI